MNKMDKQAASKVVNEESDKDRNDTNKERQS